MSDPAARQESVPAYLAENPHAGQGPVMLEIGSDTGALILSAPVELVDREIEIRPFGRARANSRQPHPHQHTHNDHTHNDHTHNDHAGTDHAGTDHAGTDHVHAPHVAVIPRALPNGGTVNCAVFPDLEPGVYTLWLMPSGPSMPVVVSAGEVSTASWHQG